MAMQPKHVRGLFVCLLSAALAGLASTAAVNSTPAATIWCYQGFHTTITPAFPMGYSICHTDSTKGCLEYRWKNWDAGFQQLAMGCGLCSDLPNGTNVECRDCQTELCNARFGLELSPKINDMKVCYASIEGRNSIYLDLVLCPVGQGCSTGTSPILGITMVGCEAHCERLNWTDCRYCKDNLCNDHADSYFDFNNTDQGAQNTVGIAKLYVSSDQAVSASVPQASPTFGVAFLAAVAALASRLTWHRQDAPPRAPV